jgi:hypothetical protein
MSTLADASGRDHPGKVRPSVYPAQNHIKNTGGNLRKRQVHPPDVMLVETTPVAHRTD